MNPLIAAILGLVQGLCEFLPVSSSGHLVLLQNIFGIEEGALFFDTMLHIGTLIAVFAVYRKTIWALLKKPFQKLTAMLVIATLATVAVTLLLGDRLESIFGGEFLGIGFLLTAVILTVNDKMAKGKNSISAMKPLSALGVGLMQGVAILPGVSRSGSTITGARLFGLDKDSAAEFSFLLSIPAILGSLVLQLPDVIREGVPHMGWGSILIGTVVAAASGYFAIRWMLRLIKEKSLRGFAVYVGILGLLVVIDQYITHIFF